VTKLKTEITGVKILGVIQRFQRSDDGLIWTARMLAQFVKEPNVDEAITYLVKNGYIYIHKGEYLIADEGREYYDNVRRRPLVARAAKIQEFRNEALSGMREERSRVTGQMVTRRSELTSAAVPTGGPDYREQETPETILMEMEKESGK
jgi:hypothetical protein